MVCTLEHGCEFEIGSGEYILITFDRNYCTHVTLLESEHVEKGCGVLFKPQAD